MKTRAIYTLKVVIGLLIIVSVFSSCVSQKKVQLLQEKSVEGISATLQQIGEKYANYPMSDSE